MTRSVWIVIDMLAVLVISIALGTSFRPADPYSVLVFSLVLFLSTAGSYFVGFQRGVTSGATTFGWTFLGRRFAAEDLWGSGGLFERFAQRFGVAVLCFSLFFCILWRPFLLCVFEPPGSGGFGLSLLTLWTTLGLFLISLIMFVHHLAVPQHRPTIAGRNVFALEVVVLVMLAITFFSLVNT